MGGAQVTSGESDHLFDEEIDSDMVMDANGNLIDHVDYNEEDDEGDEFDEQPEEEEGSANGDQEGAAAGNEMVLAASLKAGEAAPGDVSS